MPFLRFLSGFGEKNGRKVVLEPPDLRTNCACNRHLSLQLVASGLDPLPTYLRMYAGYVFGTYTCFLGQAGLSRNSFRNKVVFTIFRFAKFRAKLG
jgi:hypothetical protein